MPRDVPDTKRESLEENSKLFRDLLLGFVKVHLLYHASRGPIYGSGVSAELERHGYRLSPGTLYPVLHSLDAANFLEREDQVVGGKVRKYYRTTPLGDKALKEARSKIRELVDEIMDDGRTTRRKRNPKAGTTPNSGDR
jgi:PadR family transcriptional regulator, regulatory protein PadR